MFTQCLIKFKDMKILKITAIVVLVMTAICCCNFEKKEKEEEQSVIGKTKVDNPIREIDLLGEWTEPNPINANEVQGFELSSNNKAESINMETLKYKKWDIDNNRLILVSESIGNHTSGIDTITYEIVELNSKNLILKDGANLLKYTKK